MAKAIAKNVRMSPRKVRRVVNVIRGKDTKTAQTTLKFLPHAAARVVEKVLKSAIANAKENHNLNIETLKVSRAFVDQSTTLKRWRPMSRGRAFPILKKSSHITIEVEETESVASQAVKDVAKKAAKEAPASPKKEEKKPTAKKATTKTTKKKDESSEVKEKATKTEKKVVSKKKEEKPKKETKKTKPEGKDKK